MATEVDKVNNGFLATLVAVGTFAMVGISLALVALVRDELAVELSAKDASRDAEYQAVRKSQFEKLQSGVSIDAALAAVVRDVAADPEKATPPARAGAAAPSGQGTAGAGAAAAGSGGTGGAGAAAGGAGNTGIAPASSGQSAKETEGGAKPNVQKDGKLTPAGGAPAPQPSGSAKGGRAPADRPGGTSPPPQGASNTGSSSNPHGQ